MWENAKGSMVIMGGKKYIDFTSSIFTQNFGHSNDYVITNIMRQLTQSIHAFDYETPFRVQFEKEIKKFTGYPNAIIVSAGTEATEAAIKICLKNGYQPVGSTKAMHGRSLAAEALTGKWNIQVESNKKQRAYFVEGYRGFDCNKLDAEHIQYLKDKQAKGALIVFDEIQSGFYRTDCDFMHNKYDIKPDILLVGKALGGGLPTSVCLYRDGLSVDGLEFSTTHGAQPLQMAAACGILDFIKRGFDKAAYAKNCEIMTEFFTNIRLAGKIANQIGMVAAVKVSDEKKFYNYCISNGVIVVPTHKGWVKIAPPVIIKEEKLVHGLSVIAMAVAND